MGGFQPPKKPASNQVPVLKDEAAGQLLSQGKTLDEALADAGKSQVKEHPRRKTLDEALADSRDFQLEAIQTSLGDTIFPDARFKPDQEKQSEQEIVRMTPTEKDKIKVAFEASGFRYKNQFLRDALMRGISKENAS